MFAVKQPGSMIVEIVRSPKFRGPDFAPMPFKIVAGTSEKLKDSKGRPVWTVTAKAITTAEQDAMEAASEDKQDRVLFALQKHPGSSLAQLADLVGLKTSTGEPYRTLVRRLLEAAEKARLVKKVKGHYRLTPKGEAHLKDLADQPV
jgi:hypothetical protein